ncbi:MAG: CerR family C-terminal domain-containing protein [Paracoccaceae bacterium]
MARRSRSDGEATRARILAAAGQRIAAQGLEQTTSTEIAALAGVDLATINHHFGTRAGLYQALLAEAHRRFIDATALERLAVSRAPAGDKLKSLIRMVIGSQAIGTRWPMLVLAREVVAPSPHLALLQTEQILPKLQHVLAILAEMTGLLPDDPRLWRCLPCVVAPCALLVLARQTASPIGTRLSAGPEGEIVDQLYRFMRAGLMAIAAPQG